ncbi:hypothetical protein JCM10212_000080 [Sporobolomyces blumeae]
MYPLATLYEHQALQKLALESHRCQIGLNNALTVLFADATEYDKLKEVALEAVMSHRSSIKDAPSMTGIKESLKAGELDERSVDLLFELFGD